MDRRAKGALRKQPTYVWTIRRYGLDSELRAQTNRCGSPRQRSLRRCVVKGKSSRGAAGCAKNGSFFGKCRKTVEQAGLCCNVGLHGTLG